MKKITVLTGLTKSSPSEKYNKAVQISANLYNNSDFQDIPISQTVLDTQALDLQNAIATAANGTVGSTALMHAKEDRLFRSLKYLASYVEDVVNEMGASGEGAATAIGFIVKKPAIKSIKEFEALPTNVSGEVKLRCRAQGSCTYFWFYSDDNGNTWKEFGVNMYASITKGGFTPGSNYQFKVQILNKDGKQPFSDVINLIVPF